MSKEPPKPSDHCGLCGISPSEHAGLIALTRRLAGQIDRLTRKVDGKDTASGRRALELAAEWREAFDMPRETALAPTGPRVGAVKRAFSWGFDADQIRACYRGGRRFPFVVYGQRRVAGTDEQRKVDLTDLLKDEKTIEGLVRLSEAPVSRQERRFDRSAAPALSIDEFAARIEGARQGQDGQWSGRCPAHDDRHASLGFRQGEKGIVARCMVGCSIAEIAGALRLEVSQLFDPEKRTEPLPVREAEPLPTFAQVHRWVDAAQRNDRLADRLAEVKGWSRPTLERLRVGWDGERVTFPVRDATGELVNVIRYLPGGKPKTLGLRHRSRGLFPAPETIEGRVWLMEGEPDAVSGHELGLPAVGVPGTNGWRPEWAERLRGRSVVVCFDCDEPGRKAALAVGKSLDGHAKTVRVVDLNGARSDGFDVTDALLEGWTLERFVELAKAAPVAARFGGERAA